MTQENDDKKDIAPSFGILECFVPKQNMNLSETAAHCLLNYHQNKSKQRSKIQFCVLRPATATHKNQGTDLIESADQNARQSSARTN